VSPPQDNERPLRAKSDAALSLKIDGALADNRKLYGARKIWHVLRREGEDVAPLSADLLCKSPAGLSCCRSWTAG